jgi:hypothetical protein
MSGNRFEQPKSPGPDSARAVRVWDRVFRRVVALKRIPSGLSARGSGAALTEAWGHWLESPFAGFLKPGLLDFQNDYLLREWVTGFSLLELVRRRHRLDAADALPILLEAAPVLDRAEHAGLLEHLGLDKWFVAFHDDLELEAVSQLLHQPATEWPRWLLRVEPLRLALVAPTASDRTVVGSFFPPPELVPAVFALHRLARELMGGGSGSPRAPLGTLNDAANRVLAQALEPGRFRSAVELIESLLEHADEGGAALQTRQVPAPPAARYEIAGPARAAQAAGSILLDPGEGRGTRPLLLVGRPELRFGRSATDADLALRFTCGEEEAAELTKQLSRVHARLHWHHGEIRLLDGSDGRKSSNGTFTRDGEVKDPQGVRVRGLLMLQLGTHWRGMIMPILHSPEHTVISGALPAEGTPPIGDRPAGPWGAVYLLPCEGSRARVETVWLLEEAGFGVDPAGALKWDTESLGTAPASVLRHGGGFWLLNRRLDDLELTVSGCPVPPGFAAPLRKGMPVTAGHHTWRVLLGG